MKKNLLFVVGSLREKSFNSQLARRAGEIVADRADISFLDYADIPFMNQDMESPEPAAVARARKAVLAADGIWIFTPEYNGSFPGVLKNLLDWLSRPLVPGDMASGTAVAGKRVTVSGAGGKNATRTVRSDMARLLSFMRMDVICGEGTGVALAAENFADDILTLSAKDEDALSKQAEEFLSAVMSMPRS